jgi:putative heme iron utilization protein
VRTKDDARRLFLRESFGVLSTMSLELPGYPFGSVTPYCVDGEGFPVLYISTIAQHTRNALANPKVSLTVIERVENGDAQAAGRVTCIADALPLNGAAADAAGLRYFRYLPQAKQYRNTHDFSFFRLNPLRIRYIGGFGQIHWVEPGEFLAHNPFSSAQESGILDHMNGDHREALERYAGGDAAMIGIDGEGFDLMTDRGKMRLEFPSPIATMDEARQALIAMAGKGA